MIGRIVAAVITSAAIGFIARVVVNLVDRFHDGGIPNTVRVVIWIAAGLNMLGIAALIVFGRRGGRGSENVPFDE